MPCLVGYIKQCNRIVCRWFCKKLNSLRTTWWHFAHCCLLLITLAFQIGLLQLLQYWWSLVSVIQSLNRASHSLMLQSVLCCYCCCCLFFRRNHSWHLRYIDRSFVHCTTHDLIDCICQSTAFRLPNQLDDCMSYAKTCFKLYVCPS